ncbi:sugar phosphate isomerase/epimerase [Opitutaceae bacterium EW11]|nr:sugar phosphate isomerase/epimerase [Opitutaceae bacterium EW11]
MVKEMAALGFSHIELSHGVRITLVPGILKALEEGIVKISSTHNFCPLPTGVTQAAPNLFEPSAADPREHDQWVRQTKRSLDFAAQVKARVLVLHLGSVRFFWSNPANKLHAYVDGHPGISLGDDKKYCALRDKALVKILRRMPAYWERVKGSLEEIRAYAVEKGVALGLENREKLEELPIDADFPELLNGLGVPNTAGYWHDTGHANLKEGMAIINHREQLTANADKLLGFHLHDVSHDGQDHQPIGSGRIDFKMVSSFWKPHHLLVLELSPRLNVADVRTSKQRIDSLLTERFGPLPTK